MSFDWARMPSPLFVGPFDRILRVLSASVVNDTPGKATAAGKRRESPQGVQPCVLCFLSISSFSFFAMEPAMIRSFPRSAATAARSRSFWLALLAAMSVAGPLHVARAAILPEGDVSPGNPSSWTNGTIGYIGNTASGTLTVNDRSDLSSADAFIGYGSAATGMVTLVGAGSVWDTNAADVSIGELGNGTLNITDGARFGSGGTAYIAHYAGSSGAVTISGPSSIWTINGGDLGSNSVFVGCNGSGTMNISGGGIVNDGGGSIAYASRSIGVVRVEGAGSTWMNSGVLAVAEFGNGMLIISDGGAVTSRTSTIGADFDGTGLVTVAGSASNWTDSNSIQVGSGGNGVLNIVGGGTVATKNILIYGLLAIDVGSGSQLKINNSTGALTNSAVVRVMAGASPTAGATFTPISARFWRGGGDYQALGGTWDTTGHTFTPSIVTAGTSGSPVSLDLASVQRTLVSDNGTSGTRWIVGASFPAAASTANMTFTATAMDNGTLATLRSLLPTNRSVLSGWTFSTTDYTVDSANPIYLSFQVGAGVTQSELEVWHYDGSVWTPYAANDLTYDGNYASFTATGLSGYAMTVPEPGTLALLAAGVLGLLAHVRRKRK
jgi:T5SS/PEP-CTERM-associated repeat protein